MGRWLTSSLQRKLSIVITASMIVPLLALGLFAFLISSRITEQKTKLSGMDTLKQVEANLRYMLQDAETLSIFLIGERDIQQYLSNDEDDVQERVDILGRMTNLAASKKYIANIAIYPERFDASLSTATWYELSNVSYPPAPRGDAVKAWTGVYPVQNYAGIQNVITLVRPIRSIHDYRPIGWLAISLDEKVISKGWAALGVGMGEGRLELIGPTGEILSSMDKSRLGQSLEKIEPEVHTLIQQEGSGTATYGNGDEKRTLLYYPELLTGWTLTGTVPYDQYKSENGYILILTAVAVTLSAAISAGLIWFTVRRVTKPLRILTKHLSRMDPDRPLPLFRSDSDDEIGKLGESYNLLGAHIERLKEEVIRGEVRKKEADLRALQAQINPHFLYNTLSSIHWIALMSEEKRIAEMVEGLSDFLRISLNQGRDYCPVGQEIAHIRHYVRVQSIRFPDKFAVHYIVDPALEQRMMLKLLLQPLVENAMIHGIQPKAGTGTITILIRQEQERMNVLVLDDGVGMELDRLEHVRSSLVSLDEEEHPDSNHHWAEKEPMKQTSQGGYGLGNVNERLLLHYGAEAQLEVDSRVGGGTRISFSIPILEESP
ncbi:MULTISPECIES: cache domain-containing sensor histidine kinase [Paenibacillus]|uniref:histidine kinase n=1 Tax=Paenibacillus pabuli TaxID=1472 RepID=A0A855Y8P0_9BACL|nr:MULTISPECIES: sensor histidine kinase [Paenibacillus]PWW39625.1 two-component system sensor histidine kinase YesM [Paenibacillus pabuli]PXW06909.1 two-component system sensor histidine kinase YesM [Paenibacillus taichungensis]